MAEREMVSLQNDVEVKVANPLKEWFTVIVILLCIVAGILIYLFILGNPANFEGNDPAGHPKQGNYLGIMYKGGILVPIAIALVLINVIFSIERLITLARASGRGSVEVFVQKVQMLLENQDVDGAIALCDEQRGTVGNVVKEALITYKKMIQEKELNKEQKVAAIQKSIEESLALELPMLEKHLTIIATIVSVAVLVGLAGTVLGMIKAFSALATTGAPDAIGLANGISEALVNTAFGIIDATVATIAYNYFTSKIDDITYRIDEAGYSIIQTFVEKH
jgi:biopolymer transport protein ExbB